MHSRIYKWLVFNVLHFIRFENSKTATRKIFLIIQYQIDFFIKYFSPIFAKRRKKRLA